jgi:hypothetical protein
MVPKPASWTQSLIVVASSLEEVASLESRPPRNDLKALVCKRRDSGGGDTSGGGGAGSSSELSGIPTGGGGGGTSSLSMNNNLDRSREGSFGSAVRRASFSVLSKLSRKSLVPKLRKKDFFHLDFPQPAEAVCL